MKHLFTFFAFSLFATAPRAQVIYQERFSSYALNADGAASLAPALSVINTSAACADTFTYALASRKIPFVKPAFRCAGWAVGRLERASDTVAMVGGRLAGNVMPDIWLVLPPMTITGTNNFLSWESKCAMSGHNGEAYSVAIATTNTSAPTAADFTQIVMPSSADTSAALGNWVRHTVPLDAFAGQTIRIGFRSRNHYMGTAMMNYNFITYLDDIIVQKVATPLDAGLSTVTAPRYLPTGSNALPLSIVNRGTALITGVEIGLRVGSGPVQTQTFTSPGYPFGRELKVMFPGVVLPAAGSQPITVFIKSVNGAASPVPANDTQRFTQRVYSYKPARRALAENVTGAWCSACPLTSAPLYALGRSMGLDTLIGADHHDQFGITSPQDPFTWYSIGAAYTAAYGIDGMPRHFLNRDRRPSKHYTLHDYYNTWFEATPDASEVRAAVAEFTPVDVSIANKTFNPSTRQLSFTVRAKFVTDDDGTYTINAFLREDSCWSNSWSQATGAGPQAGYIFKNVVHIAFDGLGGAAGVIPTAQTAGAVYEKTYTYTVPAQVAGQNRYDPARLRLIGVVQRSGPQLEDKRIANVCQVPLLGLAGTAISAVSQTDAGFTLYPNPARQTVYLQAALAGPAILRAEVLDFSGRLLRTQPLGTFGAGHHAVPLDAGGLAAGVYWVRLWVDGVPQTQRLIVQ